MRYPPLVRFFVFSYFACVLLFFGILQDATAQGMPPGLPKITDLKAGSYSKTAQPDLSAVPSYQDLVNTIKLAEAYSRGNQLLPTFHEPILTRGAVGMAVFRNVSPSVVLVVVGDIQKGQFEPAGLGAGVILNPSGDVLTNWHVVNGATNGVIFLKPQGSADIANSTAYGVKLIAQDEVADLALIRILKPPPDLRPVAVGNISSIQVAEDIHVIGHPKGNLWSYTTGVVSQMRNGYEWSYSDGSKHQANVLQLQTAINPGNSGGPVVDDQGKLLGLIAMGEEGQNLDYAIADDAIQQFLVNAATARTRGGASESKPPSAEYMTGRLGDGRAVLKIMYPALVEFIIADGNGKTFALIAETSDGIELTAWGPNSFSGFKEWAIKLQNDVGVRATGTGPVPDQFRNN
jgi:S1-C subfamily serine protease